MKGDMVIIKNLLKKFKVYNVLIFIVSDINNDVIVPRAQNSKFKVFTFFCKLYKFYNNKYYKFYNIFIFYSKHQRCN